MRSRQFLLVVLSPTVLRLKAVAFAANGDNVAGCLRVLFELVPQPGNVNIDSTRPNERLVLPYTR